MNGWLKKVAAKFAALEYFVFELFGWLAFNNPLCFPALIVVLGLVEGTAIVIAVSAFLNLTSKITAIFCVFWKIFLHVKRDISIGLKIIHQAKSLYVIIVIIWIANLVLLSQIGSTELTVHDLIVQTVKYFAVTVILLLGYEIWKFIRASKSSKELVKFWFYYRSLAWLSWLIDLLIILMIIRYGFWIEMAIVQPVYILICIWILIIYDHLLASGQDLLFIADLQDLPNGKDDVEMTLEGNIWKKLSFRAGTALKRLAVWILRSRTRIFVLGSLWFEPDIATLLLRREKTTTFRRIITTTLPMTIICNTFWSVVFYLGILGYDYFRWFIE